MLGFLVVPSTPPQTLADWQEALEASKRGKGCESIPFSAERNRCISNSSRVTSACKTEAWSCDDLGTKALKATMTALDGHIARLKEDKGKLETKRTQAASETEKANHDKEIKDIDKQILEKTRTLDGLETKLKSDLSKIEDRVEKGKQCLTARNDVQDVFEDAGNAAARVTQPGIQPIAKSLIAYWKDKRDEHQTALKNVQLGIDKCNKSKAGLL
jgi:chromosome segregation ATPase